MTLPQRMYFETLLGYPKTHTGVTIFIVLHRYCGFFCLLLQIEGLWKVSFEQVYQRHFFSQAFGYSMSLCLIWYFLEYFKPFTNQKIMAQMIVRNIF